jgi:dTDP-4-amino-4,6-dideoxygalactose transaminase
MRCAKDKPVKSAIPLFKPVYTDEMAAAAAEVLASGWIASGRYVAPFGEAIARLTGQPQVCLTSDLSAAMSIALHVAGVRAGDEVVTSPFACMATNAPIALAGATAVWADVDPLTGAMTSDTVGAAITSRTRAVILYHLAGYPANAEAVAQVCRARGIPLIEDCDNALGASLRGTPVGRFGDIAVYSFYPNRQINAAEGGALAFKNEAWLAKAMRMRRFGIDTAGFRDALGEIDPNSDIPDVGWSATMSNLNCAIGLAQLADVASRLEETRRVAERLTAALRRVAGVTPVDPLPEAVPAYWTLLVRSADPYATLRTLRASGVHASRLHQRNDRYTGFKSRETPLPGVDDWEAHQLSIPCGWWMNDADIDAIASALQP